MWLARSTGWVLLTTALAYPVVAIFRRRPLNIAGMQIAMPSLGLVTGQFVLSALDWSLAAAVLYSLLPDPRPDFVLFVGSFLAAQLIALISHVPGGLGVFESLMILMLQLPAEAVLPALAIFRVVYYLVPLAVALVVLTIDEFYQRRHLVGQWGNAFGTLTTSGHAEAAGGVHDAGRRRADVLRRDADLGRPARLGPCDRAAAGHRALAFRRQPRGLRAPGGRVGPGPPAGRRVSCSAPAVSSWAS
jgi:hypothetical protein